MDRQTSVAEDTRPWDMDFSRWQRCTTSTGSGTSSSQKRARVPCVHNCRCHRRWERTAGSRPAAAASLPTDATGRARGPESGPGRTRTPNRAKEAQNPQKNNHPIQQDIGHLPSPDSLCRRFEAANSGVLKKILEMEEKAMGKASQKLQQYNKAGNNVLAVQSWGDRQKRDALQDLEQTRERGEQRLRGLQGELMACNTKLRDTQTRLQELREYRSSGYLVAAQQIEHFRRELQLLLDSHQVQAADVEVLAQTEMQSLFETHCNLKESVLQSIVQYQMDFLPPSIRRMSLENQQMKQDIAIHQQVISELQEEVSRLQETRKSLLKLKHQKIEKMCRDLLLRAPRCSPEEDVILNIPLNEEMPI